ncbi:MAG TPA: transcription termination/antitermination NusG family protein [Candidatus Acidoferrum sp.]|jgi:transcription antitermination factor NusG
MFSLAANPPMTWPATEPLSQSPQAWTVAYCKPRQEKALGWDLCRRDVSYFLPMVMRQTSSGGRRRRNLYPLFPSYLFIAGDESDRMSALRTDRIVKLIEVSETEQTRLRREISHLETAIRNQPESLELYPRLVPGTWVRIKAGPMKDVEGVVVEAHNKKKLLLGVSVLGVGATVEIHADLVESN